MLRYKLSAKIMFFFEIIAIPKRKNVILGANFGPYQSDLFVDFFIITKVSALNRIAGSGVNQCCFYRIEKT